MKHLQTLLSILFFFNLTLLHAQEAGDARLKEVSAMAAKDTFGWTTGGGIGLDLAGMGLINPRVGGGGGRFGIGGLGTLFANRKEDKWFWNNAFSIQLSAQKLRSSDPTLPRGFLKNLDVLRLTSRYGRKMGSDKWFAAVDFFAQTLLLKTYKSNYLTPINDSTDNVVAKLFAPLQVTFAPGVDYKPNAHLSFFYSPCGIQFIYVADQSIADLNIHGNDEGKKTFFGLGSEFKAAYNNKYFDNRLSITNGLRLFSNYLDEPQNIDVLFTNNLSIALFKGLSLDLLGEYFYDHNVKVQKNFGSEDLAKLPYEGRGGQWTGAFLLKYNKIF
ncbi:MAG: DUF3078 domain-containing protein [Haliscomenobacteraceae bacterium CHB4]|nr:hypothetical protein [Saprospiraceae bacterium]MCE7924379.1 DUF3078 domain-containing protein [Haliscomenobacteraceae bacterium CHB4]